MSPFAKTGEAPGRRRRRRFLRGRACWALMLALAATCVTRVRADDASITANLVDAVVEAGQPAEYHIEVTNVRPAESPPAPTVEGLSITYSGENQSRQYSFDGAVHSSSTYTYVYSVETSHAGRFMIPGQVVATTHGTLTVPAVTLNVMGAGAAAESGLAGTPARQSYFAELLVPKKNAFIGETVPAEVRVYFGWDVIAKVDPSPILNGDGFSVQKFTPPRTSVAQVNGEPFRVVTYKTALAGVKIGSVSVGPAEVSPVVSVPRGRGGRRWRDAFEDPFFNDPLAGFRQGPPKQVTLHSAPVMLEIEPLPPGKPADFSGAVGQFKLTAAVDPRKAATGDPVTAHLSLQGQGNFDRIEPPALTDDTGLRVYPATAKFKADDEVGLSGVKSFAQVIIAESARNSLPGYRFVYFDPAAGSYQTLETPPTAIAITGPPMVPPSPAPAVDSASSSPPPPATPSPPPRVPADLLPIGPDFGQTRDASAFLALDERPGFWAFQGVALLLVLGFWFFGRWRRQTRDEAVRRAAELQRQRASLSRTLQEQNTGRSAFYSAARRLAQLKVAAASNQPPADLTSAEICQSRRLPPDVAGSVEDIFQRHDELIYSGGAAAQEPVPAEERRAVLATLETLGKS